MKQKDAFIIGGDFDVKIVIGVGDGKSTHIQKICQNKVNNENGNFLLNINFILYSLPMRFFDKWSNVLLRKNKTLKYLIQDPLTVTSQDLIVKH